MPLLSVFHLFTISLIFHTTLSLCLSRAYLFTHGSTRHLSHWWGRTPGWCRSYCATCTRYTHTTIARYTHYSCSSLTANSHTCMIVSLRYTCLALSFLSAPALLPFLSPPLFTVLHRISSRFHISVLTLSSLRFCTLVSHPLSRSRSICLIFYTLSHTFRYRTHSSLRFTRRTHRLASLCDSAFLPPHGALPRSYSLTMPPLSLSWPLLSISTPQEDSSFWEPLLSHCAGPHIGIMPAHLSRVWELLSHWLVGLHTHSTYTHFSLSLSILSLSQVVHSSHIRDTHCSSTTAGRHLSHSLYRNGWRWGGLLRLISPLTISLVCVSLFIAYTPRHLLYTLSLSLTILTLPSTLTAFEEELCMHTHTSLSVPMHIHTCHTSLSHTPTVLPLSLLLSLDHPWDTHCLHWLHGTSGVACLPLPPLHLCILSHTPLSLYSFACLVLPHPCLHGIYICLHNVSLFHAHFHSHTRILLLISFRPFYWNVSLSMLPYLAFAFSLILSMG